MGETQHFNIGTPIPSIIDEEDDTNRTPIPTPRVYNGEDESHNDTDKESKDEEQAKTKRRKTDTIDVNETPLAYPPGIRLRRKTSAAEISRMRNEAGTT